MLHGCVFVCVVLVCYVFLVCVDSRCFGLCCIVMSVACFALFGVPLFRFVLLCFV